MKKTLYMNYRILFISISTIIGYSFPSLYSQQKWNYPLIQPDTAIDYYFGTKVIDPFRNLENMEDPEVQDWFVKQREFCDTILASITNIDSLENEVDSSWKSSPIFALFPRPAGNRTFFSRMYYTDGFEKLMYFDSTTLKYVELFSTDSLNTKDDTTYYSIMYYEPSFDGKYIVIGLSHENMFEMYIMDVDKKQFLPEKFTRVEGGNPQWLPDNSGFFYQQFRDTITNADKNAPYEKGKVKLHYLDTKPEDDKEIFSQEVNKILSIQDIDFPLIYTYPSSEYVLAAVNHGTGYYSRLFFAPVKDIIEKQASSIYWEPVCGHEDKVANYTLYDDTLFVLSYGKNPNGMLEKISLPELSDIEILKEGHENVLKEMVMTENAVYLSVVENNISKILKIDLHSSVQSYVNLPYEGLAYLIPFFEVPSFYQHHKNLYFELMSWNKKSKIFLYNSTDQHFVQTDITPPRINGDPENLVVSRFEIPSHDGTLVPLTIIYNMGIKLDGQNPTILKAYGAYGYSVYPTFFESRLSWFNRGGVYAIAHVRGGGEKGEAWYKGGYKKTKPNSWKDYIACAEYLIREKYTSPDKLAGIGESAGGITIGRAITERPELFKAVALFCPPLNNLRYENANSTANMAEFGTTKDSLEFQYLLNMDTYHHIGNRTDYPSLLIYAGMLDKRVVPWLPGKVVAKMQMVNNYDNITLFKTEEAGHDAYSDYYYCYSFLFWQLGHPDFKLNKKEFFYMK